MKKKKGFTLVELLAVIVILAVILVIAVPQIMSVIESARKGSIESTAKLIAEGAEREYASKNILQENIENIKCSDVVKMNDVDYNDSLCTISFDNGVAKVTISGKKGGKFDNISCSGTKDNMICKKKESPKLPMKAESYVSALYNYDAETNNLKKDNTRDANIRYYGSSPNNYVKFSDSEDLWRIIGVFGDKVKLIRSESVKRTSTWSSSDSNINRGFGINQWGPSINTADNSIYPGADLQVYLNGDYYNGLSEKTKSSLDNTHIWNTGAIGYEETKNTVAFYNAERGTLIGKRCTADEKGNCNDTIERKTTWQGSIALPYVTDWAYASATERCETEINYRDGNRNYVCTYENWISSSIHGFIWTISPFTNTNTNSNGTLLNESSFVWAVGGTGAEEDAATSNPNVIYAVCPSIFLKNDIQFTSGTGTSSDPYIID